MTHLKRRCRLELERDRLAAQILARHVLRQVYAYLLQLSNTCRSSKLRNGVATTSLSDSCV